MKAHVIRVGYTQFAIPENALTIPFMDALGKAIVVELDEAGRNYIAATANSQRQIVLEINKEVPDGTF